MANNPPAGWPHVNPYLYYADVATALEWLARAFGFEEIERVEGEDGAVTHAEMRFEDGIVMLGCPGAEYRGPGATGTRHGMQYIYVDDVDAHCARARAAGAAILEEPADQFYGDRRYQCEDPEGHRWAFATHVRDVDPSEYRS